MYNHNYTYRDELRSEDEKLNPELLKARVDEIVDNLVSNQKRKRIRLARNQYKGIRDPSEYSEIERTFGITAPLNMKFYPLTKRIAKALVGKYDPSELEYKVAVTDSMTLHSVETQRQNAASGIILQKMQEQVNNNLKYFQRFGEAGSPAPILNERILGDIKRQFETEWRSSYEETGNKLLEYHMTSPSMNLPKVMESMTFDYIVTGETGCRFIVEELGNDPIVKKCLPEYLFFDVVGDDGTSKGATEVVYIEWLTYKDILKKYGHFLSKEEMETVVKSLGGSGRRWPLDDMWFGSDYGPENDRHAPHNLSVPKSTYHVKTHDDLIPVYHVEWISTNEVKTSSPDHIKALMGPRDNGKPLPKSLTTRMECLYGGIRIGAADGIYVQLGRANYEPRSTADYRKTHLSFKGYFNDPDPVTKETYSIMLDTKDIQDTYDILHLIRDSLLHNAGVGGSRIHIESIPREFGKNFWERLDTFMLYKRSGAEFISTRHLGEGESFNQYGEFRSSLDGGMLQQVDSVISRIENQVHILTSTTPQLLGEIQQRDAVSNTNRSLLQVDMMNKILYKDLVRMSQEVMTGMLDVCKVAYKDGGPRSFFILGPSGHTVFKLNPNNLCLSDLNVKITSNPEVSGLLTHLKNMVMQQSQAGQLDSTTAIKLMMSNSTAELSNTLDYIQRSTAAKETSTQEYQAQVDSLNSQLQQLQQQVDFFKQKNLDLEERKIRLDEEKVKADSEKKKADVQLKRDELEFEKEKHEQESDIKEKELALNALK